MAVKQLTLDTLKDCDFGKSDKAFRVALERAVRDCLDRPADDRARQVALMIELVPVKEIHDNVISCEGAKGKFKIQCKLPAWETEAVSFGVQTNGNLLFNEDSPRDFHQNSLDMDGEGDERDVRGV